MTYKGRYSIKNTSKYEGDPSRCVFRSLWERQVFRWCDENPSIIRWSSEETVVPYRCKTDNKIHRYFPDFYIKVGKKFDIWTEKTIKGLGIKLLT